jgi:hypothetical protein
MVLARWMWMDDVGSCRRRIPGLPATNGKPRHWPAAFSDARRGLNRHRRSGRRRFSGRWRRGGTRLGGYGKAYVGELAGLERRFVPAELVANVIGVLLQVWFEYGAAVGSTRIPNDQHIVSRVVNNWGPSLLVTPSCRRSGF